jgi:hypothetical protein
MVERDNSDSGSDTEMKPVAFVKKAEDIEGAEKKKLAGNEALKGGNKELAITLYSEALELHYHETILTNRAAAYI